MKMMRLEARGASHAARPLPFALAVAGLAFVTMPSILALDAAKEPAEVRQEEALGVEVTSVVFPEAIGRTLSPRGGWLPVYVELRATSQDPQTVIIESTVTSQERRPFRIREWVEVGAGARRRAWTYVWAVPGDVQQLAVLDIRKPDQTIVRQGDRWVMSSYDQGEPAVNALVVGDRFAALTPWPSGMILPRGSQGSTQISESAVAFPARTLPDSVLGYQGFDLVVLRDLGADVLEPGQVEALRSWVWLGGLLIVAPAARGAEIYRSELLTRLLGDSLVDPALAECIPANLWFVERGDEDTAGMPLSAQAPSTSRAGPFARPRDFRAPSLTLLDPVRGGWESQVLSVELDEPSDSLDGRRLYVELRRGEGHVGIVTFAGESPNEDNAAFLRLFWAKLLGDQIQTGFGRSSLASRAARLIAPELERHLDDRSRDVGLPLFTGLIVAYILIIGPGIHILLRRKNRLTAIIWVEPLFVVLYLGIIFAFGYVTKGVLTKTRVRTFLSQRQGESLALRQSYLTIFSGAEQTYRIDCDRGFLLQPIFKNKEQEVPVQLARRTDGAPGVRGEGASLSLEGHKLAHWEQGHFVNLEVLDLSGEGIVLTLSPAKPKLGGEPITVTLENRLPHAVSGGALQLGGLHPVPRIEPGKTVSFVLGSKVDEALDSFRSEWGPKLAEIEALQGDGFGWRGNLLLAAVLERKDVDFRLDRRFTLRDKLDVYLLYASP